MLGLDLGPSYYLFWARDRPLITITTESNYKVHNLPGGLFTNMN